MSHHSSAVASPFGTPIAERTVGELVAERPSRSRVFQAAQMDFCCQGGKTLREACEKKGISLDTIIKQLEVEAAKSGKPAFNAAELPPQELATYIVKTHHRFLRRELPRLHAMAQRVAHVHGGHTPSLVTVFEVFTAMSQELQNHMIKEELILFPGIEKLSRGENLLMPLDGPIACMLREHDDAGQAMARLHELTHGFTPPEEACNTYRALFAGLADLEQDLHCHIHLENHVLFPQARELAGLAR